jgi:hypothetical protein
VAGFAAGAAIALVTPPASANPERLRNFERVILRIN